MNFKWILPNVVTILTLIVLWNSLKVTKEQFTIINQGYLHITPQIICGQESQKDLLLKIKYISPDIRIDYLSPRVTMENIGNIPLQYEVEQYDTYINGILCSEAIEEGSGIGIIYPKQKLNFDRRPVDFKKINVENVIYSELKDIKLKNILKIKYFSINAPKDIKYIDRQFSWKFLDNMYQIHWKEFNDRF